MVDRGLCDGHHAIDKENAVWYALSCQRNSHGPSGRLYELIEDKAKLTFNIQDRFPDASEESHAACVGRLVYYRYINPAVVFVYLSIFVSKYADCLAAHQRHLILYRIPSMWQLARILLKFPKYSRRSPVAQNLETIARVMYL